MNNNNEKDAVRLNATEYDARKLVLQAKTYPQINVKRGDIDSSPNGVIISDRVRKPIIVSHEGRYVVLIAPSNSVVHKKPATKEEKAEQVSCRLATKYALKKAIQNTTLIKTTPRAPVSYRDSLKSDLSYPSFEAENFNNKSTRTWRPR